MSVVLAFPGAPDRAVRRNRHADRDLFSATNVAGHPAAASPLHAWWVASQRLAAAACPGGPDGNTARAALRHLAATGVRHLVDLTEAHEHASYHALLPALSLALERPVGYERHPITEGGVPGIAAANRLLDRLDALVAVGAVPCLHGLAGRGRPAMVAACWLVRHGETPQAALARVARLWQAADRTPRGNDLPETLMQRRFVHDWGRCDRLRALASGVGRVA